MSSQHSDHVGNYLGLARPRWALDDPALASQHCGNHLELTGVGVADQEALPVGWISNWLRRPSVVSGAEHVGSACITSECGNNIVAHKLLRMRQQLLNKLELLECKVT